LDKDTNQEEHYEEKPVGNHIYAQKFFSAGHSPSQKKHAHHPGPNIVLLTASLEEYAKQTLPSAQLESARTDLLNRLMNTVEHLYEGKVRMEVFGSCAANLSSKTSDLDVCLSFKENDSAHQDHEQLAILAKLDKRLREEDYGTPFTILSARVPIVKLTDTKTGIECDFAIRVGRHRLKSRFLQLLTKHDQRFRALVLAIKFWSKRRYVGDASRGTLNSFGHTLLIVHYLQACENPIFPVIELVKNDTREVVRFNSLEPLQCNEDDISWDENAFSNFEMKNHLSLGELLFGYFEYYATKFDPSQHIVSTHQKELIYSDTSQRKMLFQERQKSFFCVQDPVDLSDNVGRNMFHDAVVFVMREFRRAYKMLANGATFEQLCENPPEAPLLYQPQGYVTPQSGMKPKSESIYKESQSSNEVELKSSISTSVTVTTEKSLEDKEMKANGKSSS
jgi:DNA polymerase sigma